MTKRENITSTNSTFSHNVMESKMYADKNCDNETVYRNGGVQGWWRTKLAAPRERKTQLSSLSLLVWGKTKFCRTTRTITTVEELVWFY
jgi:hypothetical protein